jgi:flagellar motor switch/type III secretory pathway protein FliN
VTIRPSPYPWHALEKVPRATLGAARDGLATLGTKGLANALANAARDHLGTGCTVEILVRRVRASQPSRPVYGDGAVCLFANPTRTLLALVEVEPELAHHVASTLLSRPPLWVDRAQPTPPALHPAIGAFLLSCVRRAAPESGLHLVAVGPAARPPFLAAGTASAVLDATIEVAGSRYGASVWWHATPAPSGEPEPFRRPALRSMGELPLCLEVVAAVSSISRGDLSTLEPGDAWLAGEGWTVQLRDGVLMGDVSLMAPGGSRGWCGQLRQDGGIVLRGRTMQEKDGQDVSGTPASVPGSELPVDVLADVPVVVRVEVGSVTLSAREWSALQPGDVVLTGRRIAERVSLRVGGIEVARGELVDVEGELGVRIHELLASKDGAT